jgi:sterol desaturase/sphingolipid hydroxylase (fatty acid hydroxylase superfamily)
MTLEFETIRFIVLFVSFFGVALWETFRPRRKPASPAGRRWTTVFLLFLINIGIAAIVQSDRSESTLAPFWQSIYAPSGWMAQLAVGIAVFLLLDFLHYAHHRLLHTIPFLWRIHAVHHSDRDVDVSTTYLHHPLESLLVVCVLAIGVTAAGFPGVVLAAYSIIATLMAPFLHGNVALPAVMERWLSLVFITGNLHRAHHSTVMEEGNSNYGTILSIWDRMFGTLTAVPKAGHEGLQFGIAEMEGPGRQGLLELLAAPFRMKPASRLLPDRR